MSDTPLCDRFFSDKRLSQEAIEGFTRTFERDLAKINDMLHKAVQREEELLDELAALREKDRLSAAALSAVAASLAAVTRERDELEVNKMQCEEENADLRVDVQRLKRERDALGQKVKDIMSWAGGFEIFIMQRVSEVKRLRAENATLRALLRKHQWAGTAYGFGGSTAQRCPECDGWPDGASLNVGGGRYKHGKGHSVGCAIRAALGEGE